MAKVYETKQDAIRDVITSNIKEEENSKEAFSGFAVVSTLLSSLYFEVDRLRVKLAEQSGNAKDQVWENNHVKGWVVASLGALSAVFYFVARHNVRKLKKERATRERSRCISITCA